MKNSILAALPAHDLQLMTAALTPVELERDAVLYEAGQPLSHVYFPVGSLVSYLSSTAKGQTVEVCTVGNEGMVGAASLGSGIAVFQAVVQISGGAYQMSSAALRKVVRRSDVLNDQLLQYTSALLFHVAQTAMCNKFHTVQQRLARWLLLGQVQSDSNHLTLTQDALARLLGTRRASVSVVASGLQTAGLISYHRSVIRILDRIGLESIACECYSSIARAYSRAPQKPQ